MNHILRAIILNYLWDQTLNHSKPEKDLDSLRQQIRDIDDELISLLIKRAAAAKEIGLIKKRNSQPILDPQREAFNHERNRELNNGNLPEQMIDELTRFLANWAREIQKLVR